jgi:hypothetical protein
MKEKETPPPLSISDTMVLEDEERWCACGARNPYLRAKACVDCSRASSARHYDRHRDRVLRRYHAQKRLLTDAQRQARRDRAYLAKYVQRGKIVPDACTRCAREDVSPIQPELGRPLVVVWACRVCKPRVEADLQGDVISAPPPIRQPRRERAVARRQSWAGGYEAAEAELRALSADQAEALRRAASTVNGFSISRESPLYRMNLVTVFARWRASGA